MSRTTGDDSYWEATKCRVWVCGCRSGSWRWLLRLENLQAIMCRCSRAGQRQNWFYVARGPQWNWGDETCVAGDCPNGSKMEEIMEPSGESLTRKHKCLYNLTASKRKLLSPSCVNGLHVLSWCRRNASKWTTASYVSTVLPADAYHMLWICDLIDSLKGENYITTLNLARGMAEGE